MTSPRTVSAAILAAATASYGGFGWPYGGGGGSSSGGCAEPKFLSESPADNASVGSFTEFSFVASDAEPASIVVRVNGQQVTTSVTPLRSGDLQVVVHPPTPIDTPGKVRITVDAKGKEGCSGFKPFYIDVKP
jgi:hypothetical protein